MFGGKLADLQLTQVKLADMALKVDAAALLVYRAAWAKDNGAARVTREETRLTAPRKRPPGFPDGLSCLTAAPH